MKAIHPECHNLDSNYRLIYTSVIVDIMKNLLIAMIGKK